MGVKALLGNLLVSRVVNVDSNLLPSVHAPSLIG